MLATSRIVGYDRAPLPEAFRALQLRPFDDEELRSFIEHYYRIAVPDDARERKRRIADLHEALAREPRARALARIPLLARLIALVHRFEANLPGERAALYELCVRTLVVTWPQARGRRFAELDEGLQRAVLEQLALRLQERRGAVRDGVVIDDQVSLTRAELVDTFADILKEQGRGASRAEGRELGERLVRWLEADTGLLVEQQQQPGVFGFLHLSLLEYLAGRTVLERHGGAGDGAIAAFFVEHHRRAVWQETLLLALGSEATRRSLVAAVTEALCEEAERARNVDEGREAFTTWTFLVAVLREEVGVQLAPASTAQADACEREYSLVASDFACDFASDFARYVFRYFANIAEIGIHTPVAIGERTAGSCVPSPWTSLQNATSDDEAQCTSMPIFAAVAIESWAGLVLAAAAGLEVASAALFAHCRVQDACTWLYFEPLATFALEQNPSDDTKGLLLALGAHQYQTTARWPWGKTWADLLSGPPPEHWFFAHWWHLIHGLDQGETPAGDAHRAQARACLERSDWPELAAELAKYEVIPTPKEIRDLFGTTLPTPPEPA